MFTAPSTLTHHNSTYPTISPEHHTNKLSGRIALITGAGRGLGRETALAYSAAGARVVCVARRKEDVDKVANEINMSRNSDNAAIGISADVAEPEAGSAVLRDLKAKWGQEASVSMLICAAGMTRLNVFDLEDEKLEDWWNVVEVNLFGTLIFVRAVLPEMKAQKLGTIISFASTSGSQDIPFNSAYATSKAAVIKFNQDLGVELQDTGVSCFALHPGSVSTDLGSRPGAVNPEAMEKEPRLKGLFDQFSTHELQTADLAANTCVALCVNDDAKSMSGKYIDAEQDLSQLLADAKKGESGRIAKDRLYWLKMDEL